LGRLTRVNEGNYKKFRSLISVLRLVQFADSEEKDRSSYTDVIEYIKRIITEVIRTRT